jgi:hypothetical protein
MKHTQKVINWFVACGVAMAMVANLHAETKEVNAKIVRIRGSARYTTGGSVWQDLKVGAVLHQGAIIQTAASSMVDIVFCENTPINPIQAGTATSSPSGGGAAPTSQQDIIRIYEDSVMAIDHLTVTKTSVDKVTDTELDLRAGRLIGDVNKISAASVFEIKIPNAVAGVRGSIIGVDSLGVLACQDGAFGIAYRTSQGPKSVTILGGYQFDIRTEQQTPLSGWDFGGLNRPYFPVYFPFHFQYSPYCYFSSKVGQGDQSSGGGL